MVEFERESLRNTEVLYEGDKPHEEAPLEEQFEKFAELLSCSRRRRKQNVRSSSTGRECVRSLALAYRRN